MVLKYYFLLKLLLLKKEGDLMEIGAINSALSAVTTSKTGTVAAETSMAMLDKSLELNEAMNQSMIKMMENSVNPAIGGNFDMLI